MIRRPAAIAALVVALVAGLFGAATPVAAGQPDAVNDSVVVQKDASASALSVLANDTVDPTARITATTSPAHGSVTIAADGLSVSYTPTAGYSGPDTFDYTVTDTVILTDTASVTIKVNAPPTAVDDPGVPGCNSVDSWGGAFPVPEDWGQIVLFGACAPIGNDSDADGTVVDWVIVDGTTSGDVVHVAADFVGYTPDPDFSTIAGDQPGGQWVSDSFTYRALDDDGGLSAPATMRFWVAPVNDAPTFTPGSTTIGATEDTPYSAAWATAMSPGPPNESAQTLSFEVTGTTNAGLFSVAPSLAADGTLSFTPAPNASGSATVTFVLKDDGGLESYPGVSISPDDTSDPVTVTIDVAAVPEAPIAADDTLTVAEDDPATVAFVLGNDSDPDGDSFAVTGTTDGAKGVVAISGGGAGLTYDPAPDASGSDSFTYTITDSTGATDTASVSVTITAANDAPLAGDDDLTVAEDAPTAVPVDVLADDVDVDGDGLLVTGVTDGAKGTASITGGGTGVAYLPDADATGADTFTYTVSDGAGGTDTASVAVTITAVNDAPVAAGDALVVEEDDPATAVDVLANDTDVDGDVLTVTATTDGAKGAVAIPVGGGGVTYTPDAGAAGADTFTYTVSDGNGGLDTATVSVTIGPVNDVPTLTDDAVTVTEDQAAATAVDVLANDSDVDGDTLVVTAKTNGAKGVVTIAAGGTGVTYKPNANAYGSDAFTYTASDGNGGTTTATVAVTISPVNDNPNAVNDGVPTAYTVYLRAGPTAIPVLANDTSLPDATETLTIVAVTQGAHGTVAITGGGTGLTYAATGTTTGIDVFTYTISDGNGGTDTASVRVTAAADTTRPVATAPVITASHRGRTTIRLTLTWTLTDGGSGIASQLLQRRIDGGTWLNVALASSSVRTATFTVTRGHAYTYRIRATDRSGNVGAFATSRLVQT